MQSDLEALYVAFMLGSQHLRELVKSAEPDVAPDLDAANDLLLQAVDRIAAHIDTSNISILG